MDRAQEYNAIAERIVELHESETTDQADDVLEVPLRNYTDPEIWQREIDLIYKRVPLMVALTCEMPKPGDYKAIDMVGVPLLITRDKDGKAHTFINACRHRGAPLVEDGLGKCSRFVCPYHGWTFRQDGSLAAVADAGKFGAVDKGDLGLVELPCDERVGMIFAILTPGLELDLDEWLGGMIEDVEHHHFENWTFLESKPMQGANWKIAYDGYLEGYHFRTLHPETIMKVTLPNLMDFKAFGPHMRVAYGTTQIDDLKQVPKNEWWKQEEKGFTFVRTLFPNISMYLGLGLGQIAQLIPGPTPGENLTYLYYVHVTPPENTAHEKELKQTAQFLFDVTYGEDYVFGKRIQKSLDAQPFKNVLFGRNERGNQYFHKWVDWYLADDPTQEPPTL